MDCDLEKMVRSLCRKKVIPAPAVVLNSELRYQIEYFQHDKFEVYLDSIPADQVRLREDKKKLLDEMDDVSSLQQDKLYLFANVL